MFDEIYYQPKVWFTSDTHFNAQRTLELSKRPFNTVEEMNEELIKNWNNTVKENDIVYHLGDFGDYSFVNKLNGKIILICGNYERKDNLTDYQLLEYGFSEVCSEDTLLKEIDGLMLNMSHEPSKHIDLTDSNKFNLFGHVHKTQMIKKFGLNVGTDCHNFSPIDLDTVRFYKTAIEKFYDEDVFL